MNRTLILYCDATKTRKAASYGWIAFYSGQSIAQDAGWLHRMSSVSAVGTNLGQAKQVIYGFCQ